MCGFICPPRVGCPPPWGWVPCPLSRLPSSWGEGPLFPGLTVLQVLQVDCPWAAAFLSFVVSARPVHLL